MDQRVQVGKEPIYNIVPVLAAGSSAASMNNIITCELFARKSWILQLFGLMASIDKLGRNCAKSIKSSSYFLYQDAMQSFYPINSNDVFLSMPVLMDPCPFLGWNHICSPDFTLWQSLICETYLDKVKTQEMQTRHFLYCSHNTGTISRRMTFEFFELQFNASCSSLFFK